MKNQKIRLEIKLLGKDELLVLESDMSDFNNDDCIQEQLNNTYRDIISFGEIGVRRDLIEWYTFMNCEEVEIPKIEMLEFKEGINIKKLSEELIK